MSGRKKAGFYGGNLCEGQFFFMELRLPEVNSPLLCGYVGGVKSCYGGVGNCFAPKGRLSRHSGLRFRSDRGSFADSTAAFAFGTLRAGARTRALGTKSCRGDMGAALRENIGLPRRYERRFAGMALGCGAQNGTRRGGKKGWAQNGLFGYKL